MGLDLVRGELRATNEPLPRIPPVRFRGGLRYRYNALQAGGDVVIAGEQDRVFGAETTTDGYATLKLFGVYSLQQGKLHAHVHGAAGQRDERDLFQPPLVHQGLRARDGAQLRVRLRRSLLIQAWNRAAVGRVARAGLS